MSRRLFVFVVLVLTAGWLAAPASACQTAIPENGNWTGNWTPDCTSVHRTGRFAQFYTFTLAAPVVVEIDLLSSADSYLYLLAGDSPSNGYITFDNDGGDNLNARIVRLLSAGTYTIEATTNTAGISGSFRLSLRSNGGDGCRTAISSNATVSGVWADQCVSIHRIGRYAKYYTFTLTESATVEIDSASPVDSYLFLLQGDSPSNGYITFDNDGGENLNPRISRFLAAGTYTVELTTNIAGLIGPYQLSVRTNGGGPGCRAAVASSVTRSESWSSACISVHRLGRYARYYTFTLTDPVSVEIDLTSPVNSYLFLLAGDSPANGYITFDNDGGGNFNARIVRLLAAGTYTIEATTDKPGLAGAFTMSLRSDGGGAGCRSAVSTSQTVRGSWTPVCTSVHRPGRNARYYTFTVGQPGKVQIDLTATADSYLYLLAGNTASSGVLTYDNDGGGKHNARIVRTLSAGTYTIEATTNLPGLAGPFTLLVSRPRTATTDEPEDSADLDAGR